MMNSVHVVGILFDGYKTIYHYLTKKDYIRGQRIKVLMPNGGTAEGMIVEPESCFRSLKMKWLEEV